MRSSDWSSDVCASDLQLPFTAAIDSPLLLRGGTLALAPAGVALRGDNMVPNLDAGGALAYGKRLLLDIDGRLAQWPEAWPALPPPIGASDAPLPFALAYLGPRAEEGRVGKKCVC